MFSEKEQLILRSTFEKIGSYLQQEVLDEQPVVRFMDPVALSKEMDFPIEAQGVSEQAFLSLIDQYLNFSVRTGNKQFLNQLYAGFNFPAFIGEVITALTNTSMYTYEVAPVATRIETTMIQLMNHYVGYTKGDGIFLSGGSNANLVAMFSARNKILPTARTKGLYQAYKLTAFVNEKAHYSFETAANILGIGADQVIKIASDEYGRLIPEILEQEIVASKARGEMPFFVAGTCATTLQGAYDPLDEMAAICEKHGLWLHADGSFGGSILLSEQHRHLMKGIELTDSFAWNPHKLMNIPLICSALLVKHKGTLQQNITDINTDYIFHDIDEIEDLGKKSIQCGRKVDAVKLWFAWKYFGLKGYQQRMDRLMEVAAYAEQFVRNHPSLELMSPRQSFAICFRYRPSKEVDLNTFNLNLREALRKKGRTIVNFGYMKKDLVIRLITANGELTPADMDQFFKNLLEEANLLEFSNHK